jgi:hypothetical protein
MVNGGTSIETASPSRSMSTGTRPGVQVEGPLGEARDPGHVGVGLK